MQQLTERQKVRAIYDLIGERGLYVNTNFDVFTANPEEISLAGGAGYKIPLLQANSSGYASPLLFSALTALLNQGTMFITGAPGIGKTTGAEFAGHFFTGAPLEDILAAEIKGNPQLTEEKMVARYNVGKLVTTGEEEVKPRKLLECPVKIIDEGNRMPADTLSIIMDLVDRGIVIYGDTVLRATPGPLYLTANYADEGTFQFTPPFLDRFDVAVMVTSPLPSDLTRIRQRGDEKLNGGLDALLEIPSNLKLDFEAIRRQIKELPQEKMYDISRVSAFADFLYGSLRFSEAASGNITRATKGNAWAVNQDNATAGHFTDDSFTYTLNELSIRTVKAMERYARAYAWFNGKDKVELSDLKTVLPYLLWHKVQPTSKALAEDPQWANDRISFVQGLIAKVEGEYNELEGSDTLKLYAAALHALRAGKIGDRVLSDEDKRNIARNSITNIGNTDKPYAIMLAHHIAAEYNRGVNERE